MLQIKEALPEEVKIPFFMCNSCKNVSASDSLNEAFHVDRYKNEKTRKYDQEALKKFFQNRDRAQNKLNKRISAKIINSVSQTAHEYLEIGCGEGSLLKTLEKKTNWSIQGVEIETARARYAKHEKGLNVLNNSYVKELFPKNSKTIISIHEALDHFHSIYGLLDIIKYHLSPGGFLTVVNTIYRWDAEQMKNKFHHTSYFTHEGMISMFELNGFNVHRIFNLPLPVPGLRRTIARFRWNAPFYNYNRFWTKHLFVSQKRDQLNMAETDIPIRKWKWEKKYYSPLPNA